MKKKLTTSLLVLCCSFALGTPALAAPQNLTAASTQQQTISTTRLSGQSRYETAKAISEYYNQGKVQNVILSTGNGYADALSASVLARQKEAPIVLADATVDSSKEAFDYITQHLEPAGTVYIIGGAGAIGQEFETTLDNLGFKHVVRIAGSDRYDTSYQVAVSLNNTPSTVVVSSGESYPDALSVASIAANKGWPILLTLQDTLPQVMKDYLAEKKPSKVYMTGGAGVVSDTVVQAIKGILPQADVERLSGASRFDTNAAIAQRFAPTPAAVYLATGYGFADALAGSALAARNGDPIIFVDPSVPTLPNSVADYLGKLHDGNIAPNLVAFGGSGAVPDEVLKRVSDSILGLAGEGSVEPSNPPSNNDSSTSGGKVFTSKHGFKLTIPESWKEGTYEIYDTQEFGLAVECAFKDSNGKNYGALFSILFTVNRPSTKYPDDLIGSTGSDAKMYYYFHTEAAMQSQYLSEEDYSTYMSMYQDIPKIKASAVF